MDKTWRLIDSGLLGASFNMALDEAIAVFVRKKTSLPTLRLYGWDRPSLSLGCFQKTTDINIAYCEAHNIPIVRRPTGGRAILHGNELTYSLSVRSDEGPFSKGLLDSYRKISEALVLSLQKIGLNVEAEKKREQGRVINKSPLCFQSSSFGEILTDNRKIVGSAQKRWNDALLQQGSIPYSYSEKTLNHIFGNKRTAALRKITIGIKEILPEFEEDKFKKAISAAFEECFSIRFVLTHPSQEELALAQELEARKYLQQWWNQRC